MNTLRDRTKAFALRIIRLYIALPKSELAKILGRQVVRSGTSPGAHCREAFRARSNAEMISKLETALQELDETIYWLELLTESAIVRGQLLEPLMAEANELIAIIVTSVKTVKKRRR
jgi:four helix bundle protein